jgi:hypothetical protein
MLQLTGLVFLTALAVMAQTTTGTFFGVVRDSSGGVLAGASVTATQTETSRTRTTVTDNLGEYLITNLPVGLYSLTVERAGFRRSIQEGITLEVNQNARVDATLSVGQLTESISVNAEATGVDTRSTSVGEVIDRARIQELPLNGRNAMELARIVPGVARTSAPTAIAQARSGPAVIVAGGRDTQNEVRFDGTSNKNPLQNNIFNLPSPDAIQEFKVLTSNFSAEYGRFGGGLFVAATRAGTNKIHGSAWEYLRNKALNARNFFSTDKPDLKQNQFGFTAGGPVIRNRTFVFGSYQGTRIRQSQLFATAQPPSALERDGNFSASARRPNDPLTGQPFPDGKIPPRDSTRLRSSCGIDTFRSRTPTDDTSAWLRGPPTGTNTSGAPITTSVRRIPPTFATFATARSSSSRTAMWTTTLSARSGSPPPTGPSRTQRHSVRRC